MPEPSPFPANAFQWFLRLSGRSLWQNKVRTGLTIVGIMLGVGILLAINLANDMALNNFKDTLDRIAGTNNLTIRPTQTDTLDETMLYRLRWLWQAHGRIHPGIEQTALYFDPKASTQNPKTTSISTNSDPRAVIQMIGMDMIGAVQADTGDMKLQSGAGNGLSILEPNHVFIGSTLAKTHHLKPGDTFQVLINDQVQPLIVSGVLSAGGLGSAYGGNLASMDLSTAQTLFHLEGRLSKIDLEVPEADLLAIQDKLNRELPSGISAQRPSQRGAQVEKMLQAYRYNLTTLSFIALLVGMFLIYNTMSIAIIRRRPEIGTLRAIGVSQRAIFMLFLGEAAFIGVIGTVLGLGFGVFLAQFTIKAVALTVAALYTGEILDAFSINPAMLAAGFGFGLLMTLIGAIAPVLEAMGVSPAEASRRASYETRVEKYAGRLGWAGLAMAAISVIAAFQPAINGLPLFGFVSALALILAVALLMPLVLRWILNTLLPLLGMVFQTEGRLAGLILKGALGRTAVAVVSLMIGIAMMASLAIMISSFRKTVITWVDQTIRADLWVEPASRMDSKQTGRMNPVAIAAIRNTPGVAAVDTFYEFPIEFKGNPTRLGVGDFDTLGKYGHLLFMNNEATGPVLERTLHAPALIATEAFATRNHQKAGDVITLETPSGPQAFKIEALYYDYSSDLGYLIMPRKWYRQFYHNDAVSNLAVYLKPHTDTEVIRQQIFAETSKPGKGFSRLLIRSNGELRAEVLRVFDRTFSITYALHGIAIIVALLAVMNSLFAMVLEARREYGIVRYLGGSAWQIIRIVLIKAGLLGIFGGVSGLGVGFALSILLIEVINKQSFGWTIRFDVPLPFLLQTLLLVVGTALLAGLIPARFASKTPSPQVIRSE